MKTLQQINRIIQQEVILNVDTIVRACLIGDCYSVLGAWPEEVVVYDDDLEEYGEEVYHYLAVSDYLGDKLAAVGAHVFGTHLGKVWARTEGGQAIIADGMMQRALDYDFDELQAGEV